MPHVLDTCLLIDIADSDPAFGVPSADLVDAYREQGLAICPISYVELAPVFDGDVAKQNTFLEELGVSFTESWLNDDSLAAHKTWNTHVKRKRKGEAPKRPIADILIGAFASRFDGLLTRNPEDFRTLFPNLPIITPPAPAALEE